MHPCTTVTADTEAHTTTLGLIPGTPLPTTKERQYPF